MNNNRVTNFVFMVYINQSCVLGGKVPNKRDIIVTLSRITVEITSNLSLNLSGELF